MTRFGKILWPVVLAAVALAPNAFAAGVYFGGGLGSFGEVEITSPGFFGRSDMGATWAVGGGFAIPVWWWHGAVTASLELSTDVNLTMIDKQLDRPYFDYTYLKVTAIPIRESLVFSIGAGPHGMIKPYIGFGGGVSIVKWSAYYSAPGFGDLDIDDGTAVKPTFSIPFGCNFRLGSNFSLGPRAEYVIVTGEVDGINPYETEPFDATVPNVFFFGAEARFDL